MTILAKRQCVAKPFLKWAGGKTQLLDEINQRLPDGLSSGETETYIEPFVGGGAVFFHIVHHFPEIKHFYLFDINPDLVACYNAIKTNVEGVIAELRSLDAAFKRKTAGRKDFFYDVRTQFNTDRDPAKLIFLNKTCYNGLYRVNSKGLFNVPFGDYKNPNICDEQNLRAVSEVLSRVKTICGDFEKSEKFINANTFVYLDPPYRPISPTASFTSYTKEDFSPGDQVRLAQFCKRIAAKRARFLLSNSDPKNEDPKDHFFEDNYSGFTINRVHAIRAINCKSSGRGQIWELLITDF